MKDFEDAALAAVCRYYSLDEYACTATGDIAAAYYDCVEVCIDLRMYLVHYEGLVPRLINEPYDGSTPVYEGGQCRDLPEGWLPAEVKKEMHEGVNAAVLAFVKAISNAEGHVACKRIAIERALECEMWFNTAIEDKYPGDYSTHINFGKMALDLAKQWANKGTALHMALNRQK